MPATRKITFEQGLEFERADSAHDAAVSKLAKIEQEMLTLEMKRADARNELRAAQVRLAAARDGINPDIPELDKPKRFTTGDVEFELVQIRPGRRTERTSRWGEKTTVVLGREWIVRLVDSTQIIGTVTFRNATRESRTAGRRYVNARWESPAWFSASKSNGGRTYEFEARGKQDAIDRIVRDYLRSI